MVETSIETYPHSTKAEQAVLGGMLLSGTTWENVANIITQDDFYLEEHKLIMGAMAALVEKNSPIDVITVTEWFEANDMQDHIEGGAYISNLANRTTNASNAVSYAKIVREYSIKRQLIEVGNQITVSAFKQDQKAKVVMAETEQAVFAIAERIGQGKTYKMMGDVLKQAFHRIQELYTQSGDITGIATGYAELDRMTAGMQNSDLIIIAGRPSMGKTCLGLNIAQYAALRDDVAVAVFSMEMGADQLVMRMLSSLGQIEQGRLRSGRLEDTDWPNLTSAMTMLNDSKIFIDETPSLSPAELRVRARRLKKEHNIGMIVVDYLQLMAVPGNNENRATEVGEISRTLKAIAKELNLPVIALSQLNRQLEQRPDKRPIMADLRDSGSIEQDSDLILFIYRDEVYNPDTTKDKGMAEIIIGKHRNGSTGTVRLRFEGEFVRFTDFTTEQYYGD